MTTRVTTLVTLTRVRILMISQIKLFLRNRGFIWLLTVKREGMHAAEEMKEVEEEEEEEEEEEKKIKRACVCSCAARELSSEWYNVAVYRTCSHLTPTVLRSSSITSILAVISAVRIAAASTAASC